MDESLKDFTAALASTEPTPGGGGAAGLIGALGASLASMAAGLSARRKNAAEPDRLAALCARCKELRLCFLEQIEGDAAAFRPLAAAYRLPKDAPGRADRLRRASLDACAAAETLLRLGLETASLLDELRPLVSPLLLSDLGCAAAACRASLLSASYNVLVNIRPYPGVPEAEELRRLTEEALAALPGLEEIENAVLLELGGAR